jgi:hypothetical protein
MRTATADSTIPAEELPELLASLEDANTVELKRRPARRRPLRKLLSKEQRALHDAHAPEGIDIDDLSILGPVFVLKLRFSREGYARKLVSELWLYPDNSMVVELSTKCLPPEAFDVAAETRSFLAGKGIDVSADQETKTKKALAYFAATAAAPAP